MKVGYDDCDYSYICSDKPTAQINQKDHLDL